MKEGEKQSLLDLGFKFRDIYFKVKINFTV